MSLYIEDDGVSKFVEETLNEMRAYTTDHHPCLHCGFPTRYPLIARQSDIELFQRLIRSAEEVLNEKGFRQKLLDEIRRKAIHSMLSRRLNK